MQELPYKLVFSSTQIEQQIEQMAAEINLWAKQLKDEQGEEILSIPVMRGGLFFYSDLVRELCYSVEMSEVRSWAYLDKANEEPRDQVKASLGTVEFTGRSVLLVDDICDSGRTLQTLYTDIMKRGAKEVRTAVAVHRILPPEAAAKQFQPTWSLFHYNGPEWFVGYGMEDLGSWRNLNSIYIIPGSGLK